MEDLGRYFFPGDCYQTVVIEGSYGDGEWPSISKLDLIHSLTLSLQVTA